LEPNVGVLVPDHTVSCVCVCTAQ